MEYQIHSIFQLSDEQLTEVYALKAICEQSDRIHLKINANMLQNRKTLFPLDLLCYKENTLVGFLGMYIFHSGEAEVSAFVHPDHRQKQVFRKMLEKASSILKEQNIPQFLFIVDHSSSSGLNTATKLNATYHHSEYQMSRSPTASSNIDETSFSLVTPTIQHLDVWVELDVSSFSSTSDSEEIEQVRTFLKRNFLDESVIHYQLVEDGQIQGKISLRKYNNSGYLYGFVVAPTLRGQGIGTKILQEVIARHQGDFPTLRLEVATDNPNALKLYQKCGFQVTSRDDYYSYPVS
ncbi:GNAT family N-acetyltransferase [Risungbinella massiliensis]|uniref:GNAT family N-acetyltransferase n=1 Tax=Risungbinella massiliensis TaxID=1329796 RepID=UPI0005CC53B8|nr:GNAT family N-acetyltransferase [Risungbinella massiliensis]